MKRKEFSNAFCRIIKCLCECKCVYGLWNESAYKDEGFIMNSLCVAIDFVYDICSIPICCKYCMFTIIMRVRVC